MQMKDLKMIQDALFDDDGSMRDITFNPVPVEGVLGLIKILQRNFLLQSATNDNGDDIHSLIQSQSLMRVFAPDRGHILLNWSSQAHMISFIQLFTCWPESDKGCFIELTFSPRDLVRDRFTIGGFIKTVEQWADVLQADDYFVRYENASWKEFDENSPDVIYTRKKMQHVISSI